LGKGVAPLGEVNLPPISHARTIARGFGEGFVGERRVGKREVVQATEGGPRSWEVNRERCQRLGIAFVGRRKSHTNDSGRHASPLQG
jgi:hypothetical protein